MDSNSRNYGDHIRIENRKVSAYIKEQLDEATKDEPTENYDDTPAKKMERSLKIFQWEREEVSKFRFYVNPREWNSANKERLYSFSCFVLLKKNIGVILSDFVCSRVTMFLCGWICFLRSRFYSPFSNFNEFFPQLHFLLAVSYDVLRCFVSLDSLKNIFTYMTHVLEVSEIFKSQIFHVRPKWIFDFELFLAKRNRFGSFSDLTSRGFWN